jgi:3-hydroxybutyryl-CoA dehydrogenase
MAQDGRRKVAVLGFGTMGSGIAQVCAEHGYQVVVLEANEANLDVGWARTNEFLLGGVTRGKLTETDRDEILGRIHGTTDIAELVGASLVIEAVFEDLPTKTKLLRDAEAIVGDDVVIATNTSAFSVSSIARAVSRPQRVAGLHFFNPAPVMPLVEVVRALSSEESTIDRLVEFSASIGKTTVVVADRPGFLVNRLLMPYLNDVVQAYDDGLATAKDIDTALELGLGYPIGPLALLDLIGLDVHKHATEAAYLDSRLATLAPPPLLSRMVDAGYLGKKSGRGFRFGTERQA